MNKAVIWVLVITLIPLIFLLFLCMLDGYGMKAAGVCALLLVVVYAVAGMVLSHFKYALWSNVFFIAAGVILGIVVCIYLFLKIVRIPYGG
ncbi:hypothetical protein [Chitinophaga sp. RAB17]|uniref:hypothetical protein n=1 Tax=Chitinophaga sp. RAB17 TaxID=3233049 RepID=UPI003F926B80